MQTFTVVNTGKRVRHRAGLKFEPGVEVDVEVTPYAARAIQATRDLQIVTDDADEGIVNDPQGGLDLSGLSVKAILKQVADGGLNPQAVYEAELAGANRVSLLDKLDGMLTDSTGDAVVTKDDDSPDTSTGGDPHNDVVPDTSTPNDDTVTGTPAEDPVETGEHDESV